MLAILLLLGTSVANLFKSRRRLEVENLFLRHQLNIALRGAPHRLRLTAKPSLSSSWRAGELQPVFESILKNAVRICGAKLVHALWGFAPQDVELMQKYKDFSF
jgi:hypothetical protein